MKRGRKSFKEVYTEAKGLKNSREFYKTITEELEGVSNIKEAVHRIQEVTDGQVQMGAIPLRNALRQGCKNKRIRKSSSAWAVSHAPVGRPKMTD